MTSTPVAVSARTDTTMPASRAPGVRSRLVGWSSRLTALAIGLGVVLRLRQYLSDRSLWLDESLIVDNLVNRSWRGLLHPLANGQGAPIGWLEVQRTVIAVLGSSEPALRLVPLVAGCLLLGCVADIARRVLSPALVPVAVLLAAIAPSLVRYSTEVKQYESDALAVAVAVDVGLLVLGVAPGRLTRRHGLGLAVVGGAIALLSFPGLLAFAGVLLVLLVQRAAARDRAGAVLLVLSAVGYGVAAAVQYLTVARQLHGSVILAVYWSSGYPPPHTGIPGVLRWLPRVWRALVANPMHLALPWLTLVLAVVGAAVVAARRGWAVAALLLVPVAVRLAAAIDESYPLAERLALDVVPPMLILLVATADVLRPPVTRSVHRRPASRPAGRTAALATLALLVPTAVVAAPDVRDAVRRARTPLQITELRPVLTDVAHLRRPSDQVWTYWGSQTATVYYSKRLHFPVQRSIGLFTNVPCDERREFLGLPAGTRIWLVGGALDPREVKAPPGPGNPDDLAALQQRFARYARPVQRFTSHEAVAVLYVVGRLARPSPATQRADDRAAPAGMCIEPAPY